MPKSSKLLLSSCALIVFAATGGVAAPSDQDINRMDTRSESGFLRLLENSKPFIEAFLEAGAAIAKHRATGVTSSPGIGGAISNTIVKGGEVGVELGITDYKVSRDQQQKIGVYAHEVADGRVSFDDAVDQIMGSNYTRGAGRANVEKALRAEVLKVQNQ